jgi:hypothetical protein
MNWVGNNTAIMGMILLSSLISLDSHSRILVLVWSMIIGVAIYFPRMNPMMHGMSHTEDMLLLEEDLTYQVQYALGYFLLPLWMVAVFVVEA